MRARAWGLFVLVALVGLAAGLRAPRPEAVAPPWRDEVFAFDAAHPLQYFDLLTYRATLEAALRFMHGLEVDAGDRADRSPRAEWTLSSADARRSFSLRFRHDEQGAMIEVVAGGPSAAATLRRIQAAPGINPVRASESALDDLPAVEKLLGLPRAPERDRVLASGAGYPWEPTGLEGLAEAILPLGQPAAALSPLDLAAAARALAWQAFVDNRLAPVLAPQRAAQALALAAVAQRRTTTPLADVAVARWLAPAAACADLWVLARDVPPAAGVAFSPLTESYRDFEFPKVRPNAWSFVQLVALAERAAALDAEWAVPRLARWSSGSRWSGLAHRYLATSGELGQVTRIAGRGLRAPDLEGRRVGLPLPAYAPELAPLLGPETRASGDGLETLARAPFPRLLGYCRRLRDLATRSRFADRVLIEEVAEQLLHGLAPALDVMDHHRWKLPRQTLADALASERSEHPEIARLAIDAGVGEPRRSRAERTLASAAARFPALVRPGPWSPARTAARRRDALSWAAEGELALGPLAFYGAFPAVVFQTAREIAPSDAALAERLLDWLARTNPPRAPLAGDVVPLPEEARARRADALPEAARVTPDMRARQAERRRVAGLGVAARELVAMALDREPACERAVTLAVELACERGDLAQAAERTRHQQANEPPGISWARTQAVLADAILDRDRTQALVAARKAASSMDVDLIAVHAQISAALGAEDDLESAIARLGLAGSLAERSDAWPAVCALTAALRRAARPGATPVRALDELWDEAAAKAAGIGPAFASQLARALDVARVAIPQRSALDPLRSRLAAARTTPHPSITPVTQFAARTRPPLALGPLTTRLFEPYRPDPSPGGPARTREFILPAVR